MSKGISHLSTQDQSAVDYLLISRTSIVTLFFSFESGSQERAYHA